MLDATMLEQLKQVFSALTAPVTLRVAPSSHADQAELVALLTEVAGTSDQIVIDHAHSPEAAGPRFEIIGSQSASAIAFRGIPGGHEFSSLVLSILYSDGKGKQPDAGIIDRIRALKGPIRLTTYVSLSCENCPEVVQALNLMATHHPDFRHEIVDGAIAQDEVGALGIQGVPSVMNEKQLIHSGKAQLIDLLSTLEEFFGKTAAAGEKRDLGHFDVVIIGGGPAGASAAIYSARKGLKTAIVAERFGGQLQETKGIENMISVLYTEGPRLSAQFAEHVSHYPVQIFEHRRVTKLSDGKIKQIALESGEALSADTVIIATGARWRQLGVPGEKEHIGRGVAFCAHCDGPYYKGKRIAVVGGGNSGVEAAIDLAGIVESVTLLEFTDRLKGDGVLLEKLKALPNVKIITNAKTTRVVGDGTKVTSLEYENREAAKTSQIELDGVFVQIGLLPNSHFVKDLVETTPYGEIVVDTRGRTSVPGIYAAGDVTTTPFKQIVIAMGDGAKVALSAFEDRLRAAQPPA